MKANKTNIEKYVRHMLATDARWALRALVLVYSNQTADEQTSGTTKEENGIGFTGCDAEFLTSCAKQYNKRNTLTVKQITWVQRKIAKYAGQVMRAATPFELVARFSKAQSIN